ncbi:DNA-binding response regulator [Cohnella endophytica]|uniref:DNA-binding response regulator n=1 Tax=Cohnella endophytica TaxID=2419778 RepID=A0A494XPC5_9BACL|nr:response regulator transcription factor [Cohnella endophytica]RKP51591.1 DNA-binding response regulator [Cohnella endophytica]
MHTVILVDDEVFTRKGLIKLIDWESCGFQIVAEADNGEDALEIIRKVRPDVVITDIRMPVLDGMELIRRVVEENDANPSFIIISGYDDFKYAQQAVRYGVRDFILKPIDEFEISDTLRRLNENLGREGAERLRNDSLLNDSMLESIVLGEASDTAIAQWEQRMMLRANDRLFYLFAELNDNHAWNPSAGQISSAGFKEIVHQVLQRMSGGEQPFYLHDHHNRIGILVPERALEAFNGSIERFVIRFRQALSVESGDRVFLYAGAPVSRLADIGQSYITAKETLLYKYIHDDNRFVIYDQVKTEKVNYVTFELKEVGLFVERMEELQTENVRATVESLFHNFRNDRYAPEAVKITIHQYVLGITKSIRGMDGDESALSSFAPVVGWYDLSLTLGELKRLFSEFVDESQRYIAELRKVQVKGGIQKIRGYIETNYSSNISLKSIAAFFFINPVYLGQLFKKSYGVYFNDFLLQIRINEAKKLLRQSSDIRIYEVAEKVGFSSADYFVTQFEKIEHMTPKEYRNKLLPSDKGDNPGEIESE